MSEYQNLEENVFFAVPPTAISTDTVITGNVIDLNNSSAATLADPSVPTINVVNSQSISPKAGISFRVAVPSYTDGTYQIQVEAIGIKQGITNLAEAQIAFGAVADPFANPVYALSNDSAGRLYALTFNNEYTSAQSSVGFQVIPSQDVLTSISNSISDISILTLAGATGKVFPAFALFYGSYSYVRISLKSTAVTTGATIQVLALQNINRN